MEDNSLTAIILAGGRGKRMKSDLPKVLHELRGKPMIQHSIDNVRASGIDEVIVIVGYRGDSVKERLGGSVRFAVQEEQLGTGHAVQQALPLLEGVEGSVVVCYGDMPLLSPKTIRALVEAQRRPGVQGAILTVVLDNPPDFGRVVRDDRGCVTRIVEVKDCTPEELRIKELNVGVYCFDAGSLRSALPRLTNDNAQREYYLTDVVQLLAQDGLRLESLQTENLEETLGITAAPVSIDPCVLASRHETILEGSEIEGARCRRRRKPQGGGRKDLLGVDAHHKALAQEASRDRGRGARTDPRQAS